jgi:CheY-like chemotaxis protein
LPVTTVIPSLPTGTEHILLVDDEPVLVEVGQMMLERLGYQVTTCSSGPAALEVFKNAPQDIDLVISDMTMPKMTGDKLAAALLAIKPDLPIILCTGFSSKVSDDKIAEMGIKALMMKPLAQSDMAFLVRKVLDEAKTG